MCTEHCLQYLYRMHHTLCTVKVCNVHSALYTSTVYIVHNTLYSLNTQQPKKLSKFTTVFLVTSFAAALWRSAPAFSRLFPSFHSLSRTRRLPRTLSPITPSHHSQIADSTECSSTHISLSAIKYSTSLNMQSNLFCGDQNPVINGAQAQRNVYFFKNNQTPFLY